MAPMTESQTEIDQASKTTTPNEQQYQGQTNELIRISPHDTLFPAADTADLASPDSARNPATWRVHITFKMQKGAQWEGIAQASLGVRVVLHTYRHLALAFPFAARFLPFCPALCLPRPCSSVFKIWMPSKTSLD
jgi:hypothetical protein